MSHIPSAWQSVLKRKPIGLMTGMGHANSSIQRQSWIRRRTTKGIRFFQQHRSGRTGPPSEKPVSDQKPDVEEPSPAIWNWCASSICSRSRLNQIDDWLDRHGLVLADYRSGRGDFCRYASLRIRGSIVDHLRKNSNLCRTQSRCSSRPTGPNASCNSWPRSLEREIAKNRYYRGRDDGLNRPGKCPSITDSVYDDF